MNSIEISQKLKEAIELLRNLQHFLLNYEATLEVKDSELRVLDAKIAEKKKENQEAESKASLLLAKASEEAALLRNQAQEILARSRDEQVQARAASEEARVVIQEAKARSAKVESDEKALHANTIIHERKKKALEEALHVG